ncbi:MAG: hypothetical protein MUE59_00105 [Thiobacillaceae bacterium]|jgi:hypothetical protein|nr:hypothetical protein [Thiobacillaceae bacterium]
MINRTRRRNAWIDLAKRVKAGSTHTVIDSLNDPAFAVTSCDGCGKQLTRDEFVCRVVFALVDSPHSINSAVCEDCYSTMDQDGKVAKRLFSVGLGGLLKIVKEKGRYED